MPSDQPYQQGFAIFEVMLGLLVLGVGLLGAGSALVGNLQASREVMLALRAADLTADLGEELAARGGPGQAQIAIDRWHSRAIAALPAGASASVSTTLVPGAMGAPIALSSTRLAWGSRLPGLQMELLVSDPAAGATP